MWCNQWRVSIYCLWIIIFALWISVSSAQVNRPPFFLPDGDMSGFTINENTTVGSTVYQLKGKDPDGTRIFYYISGDTFSVNKDTGIVKLIRPLDREKESNLDVIITIIDEKILRKPPNTVSIVREIKVTDHNDNYPLFEGSPYKLSISESTKLFTTVFQGITIRDFDSGANAQLSISCAKLITPLACRVFNVQNRLIDEGVYRVSISLKGIPLNYEKISTFTMTLIASDKGGLETRANISIDIVDVQDEPPKFLNAPYSITVNESLPSNSPVTHIVVKDGDESPSIKRRIKLVIIDDVKNYFKLEPKDEDTWILETTNNLMDREDPEILLDGGIYHFSLKAIELIGGLDSSYISYANVTVVIQDINDQHPQFNFKKVNLSIPEDITNGSAIPGLNLIVSDLDSGHNAKFNLKIEDLDSSNAASSAFSVSPNVAIGRTPIIIKVINSDLIDYENEFKRNFLFNIVAIQNSIVSKSLINLTISDANDNSPLFDQSEYLLQVKENSPPGNFIATIIANDKDSGEFGRITYSLKGFGSEKLSINPQTGTIRAGHCVRRIDGEDIEENCLDYETQPSYSLSLEAKDGSGRRTTVNLYIQVLDVNDNRPKFVKALYVRELFEKDQIISPPLILRATDEDGPTQGGNQEIRYKIKWTNLTGLQVDPVSGEVYLTKPISANFTLNKETGMRKKLNYEAIVEAIDGGTPPLSSEATIYIYVKSDKDGEPLFVNEPYNISIKENALPETVVTQVKATDPDGPDSNILYSLVNGAKDNFIVDPNGRVKVSPNGNLDRDIFGSYYQLTITATDSGHPVPLTATTTLSIYIEDVNNKPPYFKKDSYVAYLSEKQLEPNEVVIQVKAIDPDKNSKIRYEIDKDNIIVRDQTGAILPFVDNFKKLFKIDSITGLVRVNTAINPEKCSIIIIPIIATDIDASVHPQTSKTELTVYIQSEKKENPIFNPPWTISNPFYEIIITEEILVGSTIFNLAAKNPITGKPIIEFEKIRSTDKENFFLVNELSGSVTVNKRIDYEELTSKQLRFSVKAIAEKGNLSTKPSSIATILVSVQDINDNSPLFFQDSYKSSVAESIRHPYVILTVSASDRDSENYGTIFYSLYGEGSDLFEIQNDTGVISIKKGAILDREKKSSYNLQVTATDNFPSNETLSLSNTQRKTSVFVSIDLIDVNDNHPKFTKSTYEAIIPESAPIGYFIGSVVAFDPDEGENGRVIYEMTEIHDSSIESFFTVNETGQVFVAKSLSGKGRLEPYLIGIKAIDFGVKPLSSECTYSIIIGDIRANDGIPQFIKPAANEIIFVNENVKPGTFVYQVEAIDTDNKLSPSGQVMYKFAEPSPYFDIDPMRGIITTSKRLGRGIELDREKQENFTVILIAFDLGTPQQESQRVLLIRINDTDDNEPYFDNYHKSKIIELSEEIPIGTVIGSVKAEDKDSGQNAEIIYEILNESEKNTFAIDTRDNIGYIRTLKRLDKESIDHFNLLIRARNPYKNKQSTKRSKNKLRNQVEIIIKLLDIDDNPPKFEFPRYIISVSADTDLHTNLVTFKATDLDVSHRIMPDSIEYIIKKVQYYSSNGETISNLSYVFDLERSTGILKNEIKLKSYIGGYFDLIIQAKSIQAKPTLSSFVSCKIFVLKEKALVKIIFSKNPNEARKSLNTLRKKLQEINNLSQVNFEDAHFHQRKDGSLDFEGSEVCLELISEKNGNDYILNYKETLSLLKNESFKMMYKEFDISSIESCSKLKSSSSFSRQEFGVLLVATFIAIVSAILAFIASMMKNDLKKKMSSLAVIIGQPYYSQAMSGAKQSNIYQTPSFFNPSDEERIYEWQEAINSQADALSFRSFPTLR